MLACQPSPGAPTRKRLSRTAIELPNLSPAWSGSASRVAALPTLMRSPPTPPGHDVDWQGRAPSSTGASRSSSSQLFDAASVAKIPAPRWRVFCPSVAPVRAVGVLFGDNDAQNQTTLVVFPSGAPHFPTHTVVVQLHRLVRTEFGSQLGPLAVSRPPTRRTGPPPCRRPRSYAGGGRCAREGS